MTLCRHQSLVQCTSHVEGVAEGHTLPRMPMSDSYLKHLICSSKSYKAQTHHLLSQTVIHTKRVSFVIACVPRTRNAESDCWFRIQERMAHRWAQVLWCQSSCCPGTHSVPAPGIHAAPGTDPPLWSHVYSAVSTSHTGYRPPTGRCTALPEHQSSVSPVQSKSHVFRQSQPEPLGS